MKKILLILDGIVAKKLLDRMIKANTDDNHYDIVYINNSVLPKERPSNFTFYKLDPTSPSKLLSVLDKDIHSKILIVLTNKKETIDVVLNIRLKRKTTQITIYNIWDIEFDDQYINSYDGVAEQANSLFERLPNIPVVAQNIGLKKGEIMEIRIPFSSSYAYKYIGSIDQQDWKIFALYRNNMLLEVKPSVILKPNDLILIIGKPEVLIQVHNAITRTRGQFPMPFGRSAYIFIDCTILSKKQILHSVEQALIFHKRTKDKELYIKITKPKDPNLILEIKELVKDAINVNLTICYDNIEIEEAFKQDIHELHIGIVIFPCKMLVNKYYVKLAFSLKIPIYKIGEISLERVQNVSVLLKDKRIYQQLSPNVFDIATQLGINVKLFNITPIENENEDLVEHYENLSRIFNTHLIVKQNNKNPIREFTQESNTLQILPIRKAMQDSRRIKFLSTDSDLLSFDINKYNQILIPIFS